ncbi:hypothetical protein [Endozoicomonas sp. ALB032]|uniref:hypothetical protein n=1 Tax=Endozoicomonas sp. ALB032 TaxID=3403082 RepID=UPI003BB78F3C
MTLLISLSFFVVCQADPWTGRFIIEFELNSGFPNRSFSDQHRLPVNPSDIAEKKDYTESDSLSDIKRQQTYICREKTTFIKFISWQWLYATHLMVAYGLTLSTRYAPSSFICYSWLPVEVIVAGGWLLKSYWKPDSSPFYPFARQVLSILTQEDQCLAIITMMPGYGRNQQQGQPSGSSDQQAPQTYTHPLVHLTSLLFSNFGDGNQGPQQHQHTLDSNCFIHPCHGLCRFRPLSDSSNNGTLNSLKSSTGHTEATPRQDSCPHFADTTASAGKVVCNVIMVRQDGQLRQCGTAVKNAKALMSHKSGYHTGKKNCDMPLIGEDGRQRPCGKLCKNAHALSCHKNRYHCGQKTCDVNLVGENGQLQPCGKACINSKTLKEHKRRDHSMQQTCVAIMVGEDGQQRPCGKTFKNIETLYSHKSKYHSGQRACDETVVGKNGQQQRCGKTFKNAQTLYTHKNNYHSEQQTCCLTVVGEDGQEQQCSKVCRNAKALSNHKRRDHTGQQTCDKTLVSEDGQQRPCAKVCRNFGALQAHKRRAHTGLQTCDTTLIGKDGQARPCGVNFKNLQSLLSHKNRYHTREKTCDMTVVGKNGLQRPCRKVCKNAGSLSDHKRRHRKRKPVDVDQGDDLSHPESKKKK